MNRPVWKLPLQTQGAEALNKHSLHHMKWRVQYMRELINDKKRVNMMKWT